LQAAETRKAAARSALRDEYERLQLNAAERELVEKYRGFASTGQALATTNAGVLLTYAEHSRLLSEVASLRAEVLTSDEAQAIWNELHKRDEPMLADAWLSANAKLDRLRRISGYKETK